MPDYRKKDIIFLRCNVNLYCIGYHSICTKIDNNGFKDKFDSIRFLYIFVPDVSVYMIFHATCTNLNIRKNGR